MLFFLKKLVGGLLMPLPVILTLGVAGWILWARGRRVRLGRGLVAASLILLWGLSCPSISRTLTEPLEGSYPAFPGDSVAAVLVLGGGHSSDPDVPVSALLSDAALYRLVEGIRIAEAQPWAELMLSGFGGADPRPNAEVYREVAHALGADSARIVVDPRPRDTGEEARLWAPRLAGRPFALVTSATHMPRAVALFRAQGLEPIPAPTGHLVKDRPGWNWAELLPSEGALRVARISWHEYLGRAWAALSGGR